MTQPRGPLLFILATLMIDAIGIGIVFPIMPDLMARVGAGDIAQGSLWAGLLMSAYAGAQFLFAPVVGSLSDAFGRKPVLLAALALLALDYVVMAVAGTFWLLLLGRTLAGLAGATYITATAYIADITPPGQRAARFGLIGAAFGIGFVIGPALGGLAATWHISAPFWLAAGLSALNFVFGHLRAARIAETREPPCLRRARSERVPHHPRGFPRARAHHPADLHRGVRVRQHGLCRRSGRSGRAREFGWSTLVIGLSACQPTACLIAIVQGGLMPFAVARLGERRSRSGASRSPPSPSPASASPTPSG
jgi:DHA1 family tetracycline resistance protein-like MFS transporter